MMFLIPANDMKRGLLIIILFVLAVPVFGIFITDFRGWDDLIERSPVIVVAKYITAPADSKTKKTVAITDGVIYSDIQILLVLKGSTRTGLSSMASQYCPHSGEQFLLFANDSNDQFYTGYTAIEGYRIVPINCNFQINQLSGKTLKEQIQLILNSRLKDLNDELARDNEEKNRLEMNMSNNVPPQF
jgi:hypothetical protein